MLNYLFDESFSYFHLTYVENNITHLNVLNTYDHLRDTDKLITDRKEFKKVVSLCKICTEKKSKVDIMMYYCLAVLK